MKGIKIAIYTLIVLIGIFAIFFITILFKSLDSAHEAYKYNQKYDSVVYFYPCKKNIKGHWVNINDLNNHLKIDDAYILDFQKHDSLTEQTLRYSISTHDSFHSGYVEKYPEFHHAYIYLCESNIKSGDKTCSFILNCSDTSFSYLSQDGQIFTFKREK